MTTCTDIDYPVGDHDYKPIGEPYIKKIMLVEKTYHTIYCSRCGATKEIMIRGDLINEIQQD